MVNLRNKSLITKAMDKTFPERRKFLLEKIQKLRMLNTNIHGHSAMTRYFEFDYSEL